MLEVGNSAPTNTCNANISSKVTKLRNTNIDAINPKKVSILKTGKSSTDPWPTAKRKATEHVLQPIISRKRSTSLTHSRPMVTINTIMIEQPTIPTQNRFSIFTDCLVQDTDHTNTETNHNENTTQDSSLATHKNTRPPPIYLHGSFNHLKLLEALKTGYKNRFHLKYSSDKIKVMFNNPEDFNNFKEVCFKENIQFHTFTVSTEKILMVVLKGLIKLPEETILSNIKTQGLYPIDCTELQTHTRYPVYRVTFAPGTTLTKINQVRYVENIKIY